MNGAVMERLCRSRPRDRAELRGWVRAALGVSVPDAATCPGHDSPMDYLEHVFFERPGDPIVWANRGGGKTYYGAVATLLDLLFKPGVSVRILGGSFDQSNKMYGYLRSMLDRPGLREMVEGKVTQRGAGLVNGSGVELLAQAETSVRGQRVQKLRCDEVELFDERVWAAAQFVTRSETCGGFEVRGSVEAFSTMHRPYGLMHRLLGHAERAGLGGAGGDGGAAGYRVFRWCLMDVIGRCGPERACEGCALWGACRGRARSARGFIRVDDALSQQARSDRQAFESEMLCLRPSRSDAVFPAFSEERHVGPVEPRPELVWVGGMDFGLRNPTVVLWAQCGRTSDGRSRVEVVDEHVSRGRTIGHHLRAMGERGWPALSWIGVDPAGNQRNDHTGRTNVGMLREAGYVVRDRRLPLAEGLSMVHQRIDPAEGPNQEPGLRIDPRCRTLIESLARYHFDPEAPDRPLPVKDGADHAVDALRYLVQNLDRASGRLAARVY